MEIGKILKNNLYWRTMPERITKYDMAKIKCKKCGGQDCYKQYDDGVNFIKCPTCQYQERIRTYFKPYETQIQNNLA